MNSVVQVVRYIFKNNDPLVAPYFLAKGALFQLFKRLTGRSVVARLFNGKRIYLTPHCAVSSFLAYTPVPDRLEIMRLREIANKETVFLDIGANIGAYSVMLMDLVGDIYAFEPHPATAARCKRNFALNGWDDNKVRLLALSDVRGEVSFSDEAQDATNRITPQATGLRVQADTLDRLNLPANKPYIVKIDVEGFEAQVLRGGAEFFKTRQIRGIIFECFSEAREEVFLILKDYGYRIEPVSDNNFYATR